jgi:hypothetical protein
MVASVGSDLLTLARGGRPEAPARRGDVPADSLSARRWLGRYHTVQGLLPYGAGPFELRWQNGGLVFSIDREPVDYLLPQGNDAFLLRNLWSELRLPVTGGAPATLRPLWLDRPPAALERIPESAGH